MKTMEKKLLSSIFFIFAGCNPQPNNSQFETKSDAIKGVWKTPCTKESKNVESLFLQSKMEFNNGSGNISYIRYKNAECSDMAILMSNDLQYTLGSMTADGSTKIDLKLLASSITAFSEKIVTSNNLLKMFGYNDWKVGEPKNVSGRGTDGTSSFIPIGGMVYSIMRVFGDTLYIGNCPNNANTCDGKTEATRHSQLSDSSIYTRY